MSRQRIIAVLAIVASILVVLVLARGRDESHLQSEDARAVDAIDLTKVESTNPGQAEEKDSVPVQRTVISSTFENPIFSDVDGSQLDHQVVGDFVSKRSIGAYRIVTVNSDVLRSRIREAGSGDSFSIQLLDSNPVKLLAKGSNESSSGWSSGIGSWIGVVEGDEFSRASLMVAPDGTVNGVVRTVEAGRVKIESIKGTPHHLIWQLAPDFSKKLD